MTPLHSIARLVLVTPCLATMAADSERGWWIEGGPIVRGGPSISVSGGSYVQTQSLHAAPAPTVPAVPAADSPADRNYDDGYVRIDAGTLNPNSVGGAGNTWNWAYNDTPQYDAGAGLLTLHTVTAPGYETLQDTSFSGNDEQLSPGLDLAIGFPITESDGWRLDLSFAFEGVWGGGTSFAGTTYEERIGQATITDSYDVAATVHPQFGFPGPQTAAGGYAGTYGGPADGPSLWEGGYPVISNLPTDRNTAFQQTSIALNQISLSVDTSYYEFALAPRVSRALGRSVAFHFIPKVGLGLLDASASRSETFVEISPAGTKILGTWYDTDSELAVRLALGLRGALTANLGKGVHLGVFGGYEWSVDSVDLVVGPGSVGVDGSGFVAGGLVGVHF